MPYRTPLSLHYPCRRASHGKPPVQPMVGSFALQTAEESLPNRIVPTVALVAHAAHTPIPFKQFLVFLARILATAVGVMLESRVRPMAPQRHHQRIMHKFRPQPAAHRPTHHLARVQVNHHCQVQPALHRPQIGNIRPPDPIRCLHIKLAGQQIGCHRVDVPTLGRYLEPLLTPAP